MCIFKVVNANLTYEFKLLVLILMQMFSIHD